MQMLVECRSFVCQSFAFVSLVKVSKPNFNNNWKAISQLHTFKWSFFLRMFKKQLLPDIVLEDMHIFTESIAASNYRNLAMANCYKANAPAFYLELAAGRVYVVGGRDETGNVLSSAEAYDADHDRL